MCIYLIEFIFYQCDIYWIVSPWFPSKTSVFRDKFFEIAFSNFYSLERVRILNLLQTKYFYSD